MQQALGGEPCGVEKCRLDIRSDLTKLSDTPDLSGVRLLDGWISGNDIRGCLGYMLLVKIESSVGLIRFKAVSFEKKSERTSYSRFKRDCLSKAPWKAAVQARDGLERIKEQNILKQWDRVRLLDGWIPGPGYNFEMGNDFSGCLGT
ncbi:hypothetical protein SUGI_0122860 [Cryptomeria japonica]|nr:hypothetical protein SUGI_0122860 [Cryptomeria japonica]